MLWYGFQLAIIAGCLYAEHVTALRNGVEPKPGMAFLIGVLLCLAVAGFTEIIHEVRLSLLRRRVARAAATQESESSEKRDRLRGPGSGKTLELPRSAWVRKEP